MGIITVRLDFVLLCVGVVALALAPISIAQVPGNEWRYQMQSARAYNTHGNVIVETTGKGYRLNNPASQSEHLYRARTQTPLTPAVRRNLIRGAIGTARTVGRHPLLFGALLAADYFLLDDNWHHREIDIIDYEIPDDIVLPDGNYCWSHTAGVPYGPSGCSFNGYIKDRSDERQIEFPDAPPLQVCGTRMQSSRLWVEIGGTTCSPFTMILIRPFPASSSIGRPDENQNFDYTIDEQIDFETYDFPELENWSLDPSLLTDAIQTPGNQNLPEPIDDGPYNLPESVLDGVMDAWRETFDEYLNNIGETTDVDLNPETDTEIATPPPDGVEPLPPVPGELTPEWRTIDIVPDDFNEFENPFGNDAQCPPGEAFTVFGETYDYSWQPICDVATGARPFLIAIGYFLALLMIIRRH